MAMEQTLSIIKPDAIKRDLVGKIINCFEEEDLHIVGIKKIWLSKRDAENFYFVHREQIFFEELVEFMCSEPVVVMVLEGENAVLKNREIMGATDPQEAQSGTIREQFALSVGENSVHGSDSLENARKEIQFFFGGRTVFSKDCRK